MSDYNQADRSLPVELRVSAELTEVRTVHSRAASALDHLEYISTRQAEGGGADSFYGAPDPDVLAIREALESVVAATARFARKARRSATSPESER